MRDICLRNMCAPKKRQKKTTRCIMCPHVRISIGVNLCTDAHKQCTSTTRAPTTTTFHPISLQILCGADCRLRVSFFCPGRETRTGGNTLTGSPGVLTRVRAAEGKEWLWEAVAPLSSLSTDYEAGPRRVPSGTPQATHCLPLLCYRICRWGIRLKCEEGCMWETCLEF